MAESDHDDTVFEQTRDLLRSRLAPAPGERVGDALARLCRAAADHLDLWGVVISAMSTDATPAVLACSHEASRRVEEIQFSVGEGPAADVFAAGRLLLEADLTTALPRWPGYVPEALRHGVAAVHTFPLQLGATRFGVLSCYADRVRTLTPDEVTSLLVVAELATDLLLDTTPDGSVDHVSSDLDDVLDLRTEIFQAQGMVMVQLEVSLVEALARMRAHAFAAGVDLTELALGIIDGRIRLPRD